MKIVCPQCEFSRDIPHDRLPAKAVIATCPRCKHRFRMSADGVDKADAVAPLGSAAADYGQTDNRGDDPLPPGAIIPGSSPVDTPPDVPSDIPPDIPYDASASANSASKGVSPPPSSPSPKALGPNASGINSGDPEQSFEEQQRIAREAYERQSAAADGSDKDNPYAQDMPDDAESFALDNPWEQPRYGYPAAFYQTAMRVMFAAPRFFAGLEPTPTQWRALAFYLVVGVLQIVIERMWGEVLSSALAPVAGTDPQMQGLLQMLAPETSLAMTVLLRSAMITLELFFAAALYHLVFRLFVPAHANFSLVFQVLAYSSAPALLCIVPVAGSIVGFIWGLACSFIGCRYALRLTMAQTVMALVPLYLLGIPLIMFLLQGLAG